MFTLRVKRVNRALATTAPRRRYMLSALKAGSPYSPQSRTLCSTQASMIASFSGAC
jgi:hypothetical protein